MSKNNHVNPFRPGFGVSPSVIASRDDLVADFRESLHQWPGDPLRALLISGPRGIGKTVLLNELEDAAHQEGWITLRAQPFAIVDPLVQTTIPAAIASVTQEKQSTTRISQISIAGVGAISTSKSENTKSPLPTLITSLRELINALPDESGVFITIDEIQSASAKELWQLATTIQDLMRDNLPVAFAADGLPAGVAQLLSHSGTTFLRRATRIELKAVSPSKTAEVLRATAEIGGTAFEDAGLIAATTLTRGYPYFIQLLGSLLWQRAINNDRTVISEDDVYAVSDNAVKRLGQLVHSPAVHGLPEKELEYLNAMAKIQQGLEPVSSSAIADELGTANKSLSMVRQRLIERELIYSPRHGMLNFVIPHLGSHLRNAEVTASEWD